MALTIDTRMAPDALAPLVKRMWECSAGKIARIDSEWEDSAGAPVYTVEGTYTSRGWTDWTRGFQFGSALYQFDATGEETFLRIGREGTLRHLSAHLTHMGVHDHGFNTVSTFGNLARMADEGRMACDSWERRYYGLALRCSGAVQARRWTTLPEGGFIYSFNGPHSLFADTIRTLRVLALAHVEGHVLLEEGDSTVLLLERLVAHARATARYSVYYGEGRDIYDERGRVAHECLFNLNSRSFRCPSSQQGYSPFTTWTRGLAWVMCGYAELLEYMAVLSNDELEAYGGRVAVETFMLRAARAACDFYIERVPTDGVPYWDTGAPGLANMPGWSERASDPFNDHEPVDSSAAAIAAQGLLRVGAVLASRGDGDAARYTQAGLSVLRTLLSEPYLSTDTSHQGLLLHSVYHRPNGWDHVPAGSAVPRGEATMWGDYHLRELALYVQRLAEHDTYLTFFGPRARQEQHT